MAEKNFFFLTSTHNLSLLKLCLLACNLTWVNSPSIIKYFQLPSNLSDENRRLNLDFWTNRFVNRRLDFNRLPMFLDRFGSRYRSNVTGIIYNNEMADFDIPGHNIGDGISPSPFNFPEPNKRPFSSISPAILTNDDGRVQLVIGASGGKMITTAVSLVC